MFVQLKFHTASRTHLCYCRSLGLQLRDLLFGSWQSLFFVQFILIARTFCCTSTEVSNDELFLNFRDSRESWNSYRVDSNIHFFTGRISSDVIASYISSYGTILYFFGIKFLESVEL